MFDIKTLPSTAKKDNLGLLGAGPRPLASRQLNIVEPTTSVVVSELFPVAYNKKDNKKKMKMKKK